MCEEENPKGFLRLAPSTKYTPGLSHSWGQLGREFALGSMLSRQDNQVKPSELCEDKNVFQTKRQKGWSLWIFGMNTGHERESS